MSTEDSNRSAAAELTWPGQKRCRFCRTPLTRLQSAVGVCDSKICATRRWNESHRLRYRQRWNDYVETQRAGAEAHGAEIAAAARMLDVEVEDLHTGIVPRMDRPIAEIPDFRRADLMRHIREITAEAFTREDPGPMPKMRLDNEGSEPALSGAACMVCRGHCCILGMAANAFLRVETIDHVRRHNPDLGPDDIIAAYEEAIPEQSIENSCLYQGPLGCVLDRTWRADMCNNFQCNGKRQSLERAQGSDQMAWIATEDGIGRAVVCDGDVIHPVSPDEAAGDTEPDRVERAIAAAVSKLPAKLTETAPTYSHACRKCGAPIEPERAEKYGVCRSAACELAGRHEIPSSGPH